MPAEAQQRAAEKAELLRQEMDLAELRRALLVSQQELAQTLHVGQAAIAKLEKRTDMYVSTLRRVIEAMGGELEIVARFPDRSVRITSFEALRASESAA
jgi:predicted transcriptional regulator